MTKQITRMALVIAIFAAAAAASAQPSDAPQAPRERVSELQAEIAAHGHSARRLLELGRAQRALGELGHAIASFERARLLAPRDALVGEALRQVREEAGVAAPSPSRLERIAQRLSIREWALCAFAGAIGAALALLAVGVGRGRRRAAWVLLGASLAIGTVALVGFRVARAQLSHGIVLQDGTALRRSPFAGAEGLLQLAAGESVRLTSEPRRGGYVHAVHESGAQGWLEQARLAPLAAQRGDQG